MKYAGDMKTKNTIENNSLKEKTINNNVDYYEKFLREKIDNLENILADNYNKSADEKVLLSKIVAYQECYVQYLLSKR